AGGELGSTPNCFGDGASAGDDCFLAAACLDINMVSSMNFATCSDGKPGFVTNVQSVQANLTRPFGVLCDGTLPAGDDTTFVDGAAAQNQSIELIKQNAEDFAPPICANGLTLGGFVNFLNPSLI